MLIMGILDMKALAKITIICIKAGLTQLIALKTIAGPFRRFRTKALSTMNYTGLLLMGNSKMTDFEGMSDTMDTYNEKIQNL